MKLKKKAETLHFDNLRLLAIVGVARGLAQWIHQQLSSSDCTARKVGPGLALRMAAPPKVSTATRGTAAKPANKNSPPSAKSPTSLSPKIKIVFPATGIDPMSLRVKDNDNRWSPKVEIPNLQVD